MILQSHKSSTLAMHYAVVLQPLLAPFELWKECGGGSGKCNFLTWGCWFCEVIWMGLKIMQSCTLHWENITCFSPRLASSMIQSGSRVVVISLVERMLVDKQSWRFVTSKDLKELRYGLNCLMYANGCPQIRSQETQFFWTYRFWVSFILNIYFCFMSLGYYQIILVTICAFTSLKCYFLVTFLGMFIE